MRAVNLEKLLPSDVPSGEHILWFGRPDALGMLRRAYRADFVVGWFVLMSIWNFVLSDLESGLRAAAMSAAKTIGAGMLALLVLALLAWLTSRMALYVITTRRVVLKVGIALPIFFNIPFTTIQSASLRTFADKTGDIPLALGTDDRIAYFHLWPHARPFRFARAEPAMRSVANAAAVAEVLSRALIAASNEHATQPDAPVAAQPHRPEASSGWRDGAVAVA